MQDNVISKGGAVVQIGRDGYWVMPDGSGVLRYLFGVKKLTAMDIKKLKQAAAKSAERNVENSA
jgi:hypothetical protein